MTIGEKIKNLMEERKASPQQLATALNVSTSSVWKYFKKTNFDTEVLAKIANYFQVPITQFFEDHTTNHYNTASGTQTIAGHNNTISGNITLVAPPTGHLKIINSNGQIETVEAASLEAHRQHTLKPGTKETDKDAMIYELQQKVIELQNKLIFGDE